MLKFAKFAASVLYCFTTLTVPVERHNFRLLVIERK